MYVVFVPFRTPKTQTLNPKPNRGCVFTCIPYLFNSEPPKPKAQTPNPFDDALYGFPCNLVVPGRQNGAPEAPQGTPGPCTRRGSTEAPRAPLPGASVELRRAHVPGGSWSPSGASCWRPGPPFCYLFRFFRFTISYFSVRPTLVAQFSNRLAILWPVFINFLVNACSLYASIRSHSIFVILAVEGFCNIIKLTLCLSMFTLFRFVHVNCCFIRKLWCYLAFSWLIL